MRDNSKINEERIENVTHIVKDDKVDVLTFENDVHVTGKVTSNNDITDAGLKGYTPTSNIIESFWSLCDGSTISTASGDVTVQNVTTNMGLPNSYVDITGSSITYQPPPGCSMVRYQFRFMLGWNDDHCISHWRFYWDGNEFTQWRRSLSGRYMEQIEILDALIFIRGENAYSNSQVADHNWVTPKVMKWQGRDYGGSNEREKVHLTQYWDGDGTDMFHMPRIGITAYRYLPTRNFIPGSPNHNDTKSLNSLGALGETGSGAILH